MTPSMDTTTKTRRGGKNVEACMWTVGDVDNVDF
jgi:hypothetical protein